MQETRVITRQRNNKLTVANIITVSRLVMLPIIVYFLVQDERTIAFIIMLISLLSDGIDGYVARKFNQETELGKMLDPLCDKICLAVILITLLLINSIPIWIVILILVRDVLIIVGSYVVLKQKSVVLTSNLFGKITGIIFGAIILAYTLNLRQVGLIFLYLSIPAIIGSFILYTHRYFKVLKGAQ